MAQRLRWRRPGARPPGGTWRSPGGANTANQFLAAGLVDEVQLHLVPILLGGGERLFEGVGDLGDLKLARTAAAPNVIHVKLARG